MKPKLKPQFLGSIILLCIIMSLCFQANAQFETVYIGVNGLTCSQCSRTVEMRIRKLDFVADVQMNLQNTEGKIILAKNKKANMADLAQSVFDAGFSVRYLKADYNFDNQSFTSGPCFIFKGDEYVFNSPPAALSGKQTLKFLGKKFMPKSEYKKIQEKLETQCSNTTGTIYHVELANTDANPKAQ